MVNTLKEEATPGYWFKEFSCKLDEVIDAEDWYVEKATNKQRQLMEKAYYVDYEIKNLNGYVFVSDSLYHMAENKKDAEKKVKSFFQREKCDIVETLWDDYGHIDKEDVVINIIINNSSPRLVNN